MNIFKRPGFWIAVGCFVVIAGGGFGVYRYLQLSSELEKVKGTQTANANAEEVKRIVDKVSKLMDLSTTEEPTVATVTDVDKLRDQPFFQRAQNDDKVLIYTNERRAILYRPSVNKIIDVAPVNLSQQSSGSAEQPAGTPSPGQPARQSISGSTFAIYNGTAVTGLSRKYENELKTKVPDANVIAREAAVNQNTERTIIVDVSGSKTALVRNYSQLLGIPTGLLPTGEATPAADFLIIIGKDKELME